MKNQENTTIEIEPSKINHNVWFLALVFFVLLLLLVYLLYQNTVLRQQIILSNSEISQPRDTVSPTTVFLEESPDEFKISTHDLQGEFSFGQDYPHELFSLTENDLVKIRCTPIYAKQSDGVYKHYLSGANEFRELTDPQILSFLDKINNSEPERILQNTKQEVWVGYIRKCEMEDGAVIVSYEIFAGGGGLENSSHHILVKSTGEEIQIDIPTDGSPYFNCNTTLAMTHQSVAYLHCGGGDGGYGKSSIYSLDFNAVDYRVVYTCTSLADFLDGSIEVSCKY